MIRISAKFGNMRKEEDFIVYPRKDDAPIVIQSNHRIAKIDPVTGNGVLSIYRSNGAYFVDLLFKTIPITVSKDLIDRMIGAQPKEGDPIGPGGVVALA